MDHIYKQRCKTEQYSRGYVDQLVAELADFPKQNPRSKERLQHILNPPLSTVTEPYFLHRMKEITVPKEALSLRSVRFAVSPAYRKSQENKVKGGLLLPVPAAEVSGLKAVIDPKDTVFTARIYEPFKYVCASRKGHRVVQEVQMLGSHVLTVLRDNIRCNVGPFLDISENPEKESAAEVADSGFIFVEDTFYNDFRNPAFQDYSQVLLEWAKSKDYFKPLRTGVMEKTLVKDLSFKLGFPYVYQHFGNCEHLIVFTDVRLVTPEEREKAVLFPQMKQMPSKNVYCFLCGMCESAFTVVGSSEHIQDPTQLCHQCLTMYHYKDGQKLGSFKAYRFSK